MFNFFISEKNKADNRYYISGNDYNHIKNVLRMHEGDIFLISENGQSHLCEIESLDNESIIALIREENYQSTELPLKIYLFQGLPKSDKLELIIQKTVELGVFSIIPTEMQRCIVKVEDKKKQSKLQRWNAISESAAKQSKRSIIPEIRDIMPFEKALNFAASLDMILLPYESKNGMTDTKNVLKELRPGMSVGIFIGPEGGFEEKEVNTALQKNARVISLGQRILRTETAAIASVAMCMLHAEMYLTGETE